MKEPLLMEQKEFSYVTNDNAGEYAKESKIIYIMRGLPGSGKSTLAKTILKHHIDAGTITKDKEAICSTDDFFMINGKYEHDGSKIGWAHAWNQHCVWEKMQQQQSPIIVDNTCCTLWEAKPYVQMADHQGYGNIIIATPSTSWAFEIDELVKKNTHGVDEKGIQKMHNRFVKDISRKNVYHTPTPKNQRKFYAKLKIKFKTPDLIQIKLNQTITHKPLFENKAGTHVTLAFRPSENVTAAYTAYINEDVTVRVEKVHSSLSFGMQVASVNVDPLPCQNKHPHVTLSFNKARRPVESNTLLNNPPQDTIVNTVQEQIPGKVIHINFPIRKGDPYLSWKIHSALYSILK